MQKGNIVSLDSGVLTRMILGSQYLDFVRKTDSQQIDH